MPPSTRESAFSSSAEATNFVRAWTSTWRDWGTEAGRRGNRRRGRFRGIGPGGSGRSPPEQKDEPRPGSHGDGRAGAKQRRLVGQLDAVAPCRNRNGAEEDVGGNQRLGLAVDRRSPTWGVFVGQHRVPAGGGGTVELDPLRDVGNDLAR